MKRNIPFTAGMRKKEKSFFLPLVIGMVILGLIGYGLMTNSKQSYVAPEIKEVLKTEKVDALELRKKEAWSEKEQSAKEKAQAAYEEVMRVERVESDLEVVREVQTELDEIEIQLMASSSLVEAPTQ